MTEPDGEYDELFDSPNDDPKKVEKKPLGISMLKDMDKIEDKIRKDEEIEIEFKEEKKPKEKKVNTKELQEKVKSDKIKEVIQILKGADKGLQKGNKKGSLYAIRDAVKILEGL